MDSELSHNFGEATSAILALITQSCSDSRYKDVRKNLYEALESTLKAKNICEEWAEVDNRY